MSETSTEEAVPVQVQLAVRVLFGDEFLDRADRRFLRSFQGDPARWGRLMLDTWAVISGVVDDVPAPRAALPERPAPAPPPAAVGQPRTEPPPTAPAPAPVTAPPAGSAATGTVAAQAGAATSIDFFDPDDEPDEPAPAGRDVGQVKQRLVEVIAEASGYPPEVLDEDLDLEVDLGIDSVKQVHAVARIREEYGLTMDEDFQIGDYATIGKLAGYVADRVSSAG
ncbi:phosphopantetheine-binding protein [Actinosynnema sp. NPDC023587]|uniref:acyl carrier protein n=1 Tax=Actinosynnema sp. NPDC023587 TaxID=3154695 RepID=UPI0033BFE94B